MSSSLSIRFERLGRTGFVVTDRARPWRTLVVYRDSHPAAFAALRAAPALRSDAALWGIPLAAAILAAGFAPVPPAAAPYVEAAIENAPFFVAGVVAAPWLTRRAGRAPGGPWAVWAALALLLGAASAGAADGPAARVAFGLGGSVLVALAAREMPRRVWRSAAWRGAVAMGRLSLPIFLMHTPASALARELLLLARVDGVSVHLVAGVAAGVIVPMAATVAVRRCGLARALAVA